MSGKITLVVGGARSGKSVHAEQLVSRSTRRKIYLATAQALDDEMSERIAAHRLRRGEDWQTLEIPVAVPECIIQPVYADAIILVDCLTLWLSNLMHQSLDLAQHTLWLTKALQMTQAHVVLVTNEVGHGIVPEYALARQFRDQAGILNQQVAAVADRVVWMMTGIPVVIKGAQLEPAQ